MLVFACMLLLSLNYYHSHLGGYGLDLPFNSITWMFTSVLIGIGFWQVSVTQKLIFNKILLWIGLVSLALWIPLIYPNQEVGEFAYTRLIGILAGWFLILSFYQLNFSNDQFELFLWIIVITASIYSLASLMLFYGFFNHIITLKGNFGAGILAQRNVASTFIILALLCSVWILIKNRDLFNSASKLLLLTSTIIFSWMIFINASRVGHLSLFVVLLFTAPALYRNTNKKILQFFYISLIIGFTIPFLIGFLDNELSVTRNSLPTNQRIIMWSNSLKLFQENPIWGWGYGTFEATYHKIYEIFPNQKIYLTPELYIGHPHNELLYWAVEGGLLPLLSIIFIMLLILTIILRSPKKEKLFYIALLFPCSFHSMVEYPFYHVALVWVIFIIFLSQILKENSEIKDLKFQNTFSLKLFGTLAPIITIIFMSLNINTITKLVKFRNSNFTDFHAIEDIIFPASQITRYGNDINYIRLLIGLQRNSKEDIEAYINWHTETMKRLTRAQFYYNHIIALAALNQTDEAEKLFSKAKIYFPEDNLFTKSFKDTFLKEIKPFQKNTTNEN